MPAIQSFSDFCESAGLPLWLRDGLIEELNNRQSARLAVANATANARGGPTESPALVDERGQVWGHLVARIPKESFYYWATRKDTGPECWEDDTFLREYLRDNPHARVRTVSPRTTVRQSLALPWKGEVRSVKRYGEKAEG